MTPKHRAEKELKERRLFYELVTGKVIGVASGGGALAALTGDALIWATYAMRNPDGTELDPTTVYGCIECYCRPLHSGEPAQVDLAKVASYKTASTNFAADRTTDTLFETLCDERDACITYEYTPASTE